MIDVFQWAPGDQVVTMIGWFWLHKLPFSIFFEARGADSEALHS